MLWALQEGIPILPALRIHEKYSIAPVNQHFTDQISTGTKTTNQSTFSLQRQRRENCVCHKQFFPLCRNSKEGEREREISWYYTRLPRREQLPLQRRGLPSPANPQTRASFSLNKHSLPLGEREREWTVKITLVFHGANASDCNPRIRAASCALSKDILAIEGERERERNLARMIFLLEMAAVPAETTHTCDN